MKRPPDPSPEAGRDPLAYHDERFLESDDGRPLRILSEYLRPLGVFRRRAHPRHHRVLRLRPGHGGRGLWASTTRRRASSARLVTGVVRRAREPGPPLSGVHRRRPRDHGGRQPRRAGGRRPHHRPQHRPAPRAAPEPVHHPRALVRVPLLLHAQAVVRLRRAGHHRVPGRLRHPGRAVRVPHPVADRQDRPAGGHAALRPSGTGTRSWTSTPWCATAPSAPTTSGCCTSSTRRRRRWPCSASACGRRTRPSPRRRSPGRSRLTTSARPAAPRRRSTRLNAGSRGTLAIP